jgi:hypothetical protein
MFSVRLGRFFFFSVGVVAVAAAGELGDGAATAVTDRATGAGTGAGAGAGTDTAAAAAAAAEADAVVAAAVTAAAAEAGSALAVFFLRDMVDGDSGTCDWSNVSLKAGPHPAPSHLSHPVCVYMCMHACACVCGPTFAVAEDANQVVQLPVLLGRLERLHHRLLLRRLKQSATWERAIV